MWWNTRCCSDGCLGRTEGGVEYVEVKNMVQDVVHMYVTMYVCPGTVTVRNQ